jgi:hypothetical protein
MHFSVFYLFVSIDGVIRSVLLSRRRKLVSVFAKIQETLLSAFSPSLAGYVQQLPLPESLLSMEI